MLINANLKIKEESKKIRIKFQNEAANSNTRVNNKKNLQINRLSWLKNKTKKFKHKINK